MKKYKVYIYEQPYEVIVMATNKDQAELKAIKIHNGGDYNTILKTEVVKLVKHL